LSLLWSIPKFLHFHIVYLINLSHVS
jgi:hypothetical protein